MSDADSKTDKTAVTDPNPPANAADAGADQVQQAFDDATEKGYFGETPDETPNEAYTVKGSLKAAQQAAKDAANGK